MTFAGFQVAMYDPFLVSGRQSVGERRCITEERFKWQPPVRNDLVEGPALDQLHRQEVNSSFKAVGSHLHGLFDGKHTDDTRVVQSGESFGFTPKSVQPFRARRHLVG